MTGSGPRPPRNQHVVSQVLLSRFSEEDLVDVYALARARRWHSTTSAIGYVRDLITVDPIGSERRWAETEARLPEVFRALDDRSFLVNGDAMAVAKSCIALHFGRSFVAHEVWRRSLSDVLGESADPSRYDGADLSAAFASRYGRLPTGADDLQAIANDIADAVAARITDGRLFRDLMHSAVEQAEGRLEGMALQVGEAVAGELILGDAPATLVDASEGRIGVLQGVSWNEADTLAVPFGPRHLVAAASGPYAKSQWVNLDAHAVDRANLIQVAGALRLVFSRPAARLPTSVGGLLASIIDC